MTGPLPSVLHATTAQLRADRHPRADEDVHFTRAVAATVIGACSEPGDVVLDPFAGFGTTLAVAHDLGRRAVGVELLPERVDLVRELVPRAVVLEGDARELGALLDDVDDLEPVALCLTSPPYMTANRHPTNPLTAYETFDGDYATYLRELGDVAEQLRAAVRPGGHVVVNVADIDYRGHLTPLVDDVETAMCRALEPVQRTRVTWDRTPHDLVDDTLLVLHRTA